MECDQSTKNKRLQEAVIAYANEIPWKNPVALTLTLKQQIKKQAINVYLASANLRHFMSRLNRKIFGNAVRRHNKGLQILPVLEHDTLVRFHNHAIIDRPEEMDFDEFKAVVETTWAKTTWGYNQICIEPVTSDGWIRYIAKLNQKPEFDLAIDWMNARSDR